MFRTSWRRPQLQTWPGSVEIHLLNGYIMKNKLILLILVSILIAACGGQTAPSVEETPTSIPIPITITPDPCFEANLPAEVDKVHKYMREFDDYAALASNTPQAQLVAVIPEMQRILREAEDQNVPICLNDLKELQVRHMQTVVQTLLAFIGNSDAAMVNNGIVQARDLHAQYDVEMARLLGVTLTIATPIPTISPIQPTITQTPLVTNAGANELNLRTAPDFNAPATTVLAVGASASAIGRTADGQWILVQDPTQPDKTVWVYATVVQLSVPIDTLPVVTP